MAKTFVHEIIIDFSLNNSNINFIFDKKNMKIIKKMSYF